MFLNEHHNFKKEFQYKKKALRSQLLRQARAVNGFLKLKRAQQITLEITGHTSSKEDPLVDRFYKEWLTESINTTGKLNLTDGAEATINDKSPAPKVSRVEQVLQTMPPSRPQHVRPKRQHRPISPIPEEVKDDSQQLQTTEGPEQGTSLKTLYFIKDVPGIHDARQIIKHVN